MSREEQKGAERSRREQKGAEGEQERAKREQRDLSKVVAAAKPSVT